MQFKHVAVLSQTTASGLLSRGTPMHSTARAVISVAKLRAAYCSKPPPEGCQSMLERAPGERPV